MPPLDARFRGSHTGTGARLAAFTIDVVVVLVIATLVLVATGSAIFGGIALLECVVFLWILEARTGLTFGNRLLRIRSSRADAPFSPGVGRSAARFAMIGAGFVVGIVGAWVVVASSAWDGQRRRSGWADVATRTMTVSLPTAARKGRLPGMAAPAVYQSPQVEHVPRATEPEPLPGAIAMPAQVAFGSSESADHRDSSDLESAGSNSHSVESHSASFTVPPSDGQFPVSAPSIAAVLPPDAPLSSPPAPSSRDQASPSAQVQPASAPGSGHAAASPEPDSRGDLLLVFDTGQREQVPLTSGLVLGRNPSPIEPTDHAIVVEDPEKTVSRTHLRIEHTRGRTWVMDNGSANGTHLIDDTGHTTALAAHERTVLEDGTRVRIGQRAFSINVLTDGTNGGGGA
ncbi:FHA domain-containing protein [Demequina oxidasica]|uniref:FHA domain-containing protein n=1 Tax=Demequina oxidasica TaxID=676199 RepID=UPI0007803BAC|nr:FHA domain-containing protein [Demequina oxidasica]